jgi:hypothetical protein
MIQQSAHVCVFQSFRPRFWAIRGLVIYNLPNNWSYFTRNSLALKMRKCRRELFCKYSRQATYRQDVVAHGRHDMFNSFVFDYFHSIFHF